MPHSLIPIIIANPSLRDDPTLNNAILPAKYEAAKLALQEANSVDECKAWADKTAALASYAKQSKDEELLKTAIRIRDRAIRRIGELLSEFEAKSGKRTDLQPSGGAPTRFQAASKVGLSKDQAVNAIRVANVPRELFEKQVESDNPPTVTQLAEQGKKASNGKPFYETLGLTKEQFRGAGYFGDSLRRHAETLSQHKVKDVADGLNGLNKKQRADVLAQLKIVEDYHKKLKDRL